MTITEEQKSLFNVEQGYFLAHCISGDMALGAGIAKQIDDIYNMKVKLRDVWYGYPELPVGEAFLIDNVYNLVTKEKCYQKPTYDALRNALENMKEDMEDFCRTKLAIPRIGCGLDRLEWDKVKEIIQEVFDDTDIDILVCYI